MSEASPPEDGHFHWEPDRDNPGWHVWRAADRTLYNAFIDPLRVRVEGDIARVRMRPVRQHANMSGRLHGGALLGFMDVALFAALRGFGNPGAGAGMTIDLTTQMMDAGRPDEEVEARIEVLKETGRLVFLRGLLVQGAALDHRVASFTGTVRKFRPR